MGYELILSVGKVSKAFVKPLEPTLRWFQVYALVDLCKPGYSSEVYKLNAFEKTDDADGVAVYMFSPMGDGDTQVEKDRYDAPLHTVPIPIMLEALLMDNENDPYRRFTWAIAMLESMLDDSEELECVLFGY